MAERFMPLETDFHPDLRRIARFVPRTLATPKTVPILRRLTRLQRRGGASHVEVITLASGTNVSLHRPPSRDGTAPAMLWIHGGGYVIGHAAQDDKLCRHFVERLGITVANVDYRLAPDHPYPAALEDCYAALTWLASLPAVDPARIAIGGASAGGGLAAALALLARDRGDVEPAFQLLVYPMLDDRTVSQRRVQRQYRLWNERSNRFGWKSYLGDADPDVAVPARQPDLSRLPPAWIGVGTLDLFYDENVAYAKRLQDAGVPCEVEVVQGAFHGFDLLHRRLGVSKAFFDSQCAALRAALTP
jgi:acetyl esterase/lipase